jgi:gamma-glutamylcyclotransferase (GGCT)/AIG2-like uncharacterized protein YtfP
VSSDSANAACLLFVYGSLRSDCGHAMHRHLATGAQLLGPAAFCGLLYRIGWYPGVISSADPTHRVHGELYELSAPDELLAVLDRYEGCAPDDPPPTEYIRRLCPVRPAAGGEVLAWVYLYNRPVTGLPLIVDGRYRPLPAPTGSVG